VVTIVPFGPFGHHKSTNDRMSSETEPNLRPRLISLL
jgi:hypothetical protein